MDKEMKMVSSCLVCPEAETPNHKLWLSNLDLFSPRAHTCTVYFYRPGRDVTGQFFAPEALKDGLRRVLVPFYPFAGRLGADPDGRAVIKCEGQGVLFVEAESDIAIDCFGDFTPSPKNRRLLVPQVDSCEGDNDAIPLLMLQVTYFKCGGVCLGVGLHHYVSDGLASLNFINTWSNIVGGGGADKVITRPPSLDRTVLRARSPPSVLFGHPEYKRNPLSTSSAPPVASAILTLTLGQLTKLKNSNKHTTYEAVAAHVWRCACVARELAPDQETRAYITADARQRLKPALPQGFIGNAVFPAVAIGRAGELNSSSLGEVAGKIRESVARLDDEYLRSALDFLEMQEDLSIMGRWVGTFPATDLSIVSWTRLPIYDADFGWGRPMFMGPAAFFYAGLVYIMPNSIKDGGVSVALSLEEECMGRFKKHFNEFDKLHA